MKTLISPILASLFLFFLMGCAGPSTGVLTSDEPLETYSNLVYIDSPLKMQIPCDVLEAEKLESGRLAIYARFYNKQNEPTECQIQIKFKANDGKVVDETGWMPFLLPRREVTEFRHTSLAKNATDFTLLLREAR